jgi:hypothetical protein
MTFQIIEQAAMGKSRNDRNKEYETIQDRFQMSAQKRNDITVHLRFRPTQIGGRRHRPVPLLRNPVPRLAIGASPMQSTAESQSPNLLEDSRAPCNPPLFQRQRKVLLTKDCDFQEQILSNGAHGRFL